MGLKRPSPEELEQSSKRVCLDVEVEESGEDFAPLSDSHDGSESSSSSDSSSMAEENLVDLNSIFGYTDLPPVEEDLATPDLVTPASVFFENNLEGNTLYPPVPLVEFSLVRFRAESYLPQDLYGPPPEMYFAPDVEEEDEDSPVDEEEESEAEAESDDEDESENETACKWYGPLLQFLYCGDYRNEEGDDGKSEDGSVTLFPGEEIIQRLHSSYAETSVASESTSQIAINQTPQNLTGLYHVERAEDVVEKVSLSIHEHAYVELGPNETGRFFLTSAVCGQVRFKECTEDSDEPRESLEMQWKCLAPNVEESSEIPWMNASFSWDPKGTPIMTLSILGFKVALSLAHISPGHAVGR